MGQAKSPAPLNFGAIPTVGNRTPGQPDGVTAPPPATGPNFGDIPVLSGPGGDLANMVGRGHRAYTGAIIDTVKGFDPRTPAGRQNIAGGVAGAAGAYATGGLGAVPWIARLLGTPVAAGAGGALAESAEQMVGTKPGSLRAVADAGLTQGAYELAGKTILWPIKKLTTRFVAVPRLAREVKETVEGRVREAKIAAGELVDDAREAGRKFMTGERAGVQQGVRAAEKSAALDIDAATMKGQREIADARAIYDDLVKNSVPDPIAGGQAVKAVVNPRATPGMPVGAAQRALDELGARVSKAAESGPGIAIRPLQEALDQMIRAARPPAIFNAGGAQVDQAAVASLQDLRRKIVARHGDTAAIAPGQPGGILHGDLAVIDKEMARLLGVAETHPLPGLLGKIATMPDGTVLDFKTAHQMKKLLDEGVDFDRTASKHIEQIMKALRGQLREAMSVHEPYNQATQAFQRAVPLYRQGVGEMLIKLALEDPDKAVRVLKADNPAQAQAVKDLLVTKAAEGGGAAQGLQAWQAIQSQWVFDNIILGGPKDLSKRLATVLTESPQFAKIVLDDKTAQQVLSNLDHIGQGYQLAEQQAGEMLLRTKGAAAAKVQGVKDAGARRITGAQEAVADSRRVASQTGRAGVESAQAVARDFDKSKVSKHARPLDEQFTGLDVARAAALPGTVSGVLAMLRLMTGPGRDEIVQWAAYSSQNTERLVRALNSQLPATAVADLARELTAVARPAPPVAPPANSATLPASRR